MFRPHGAALRWFVIVAGVSLARCSASTSTSTTAPSGLKCEVSASASPSSFSAGGGSGALSVSTERECAWTADAPWIAFSGGAEGQGTAVVGCAVTPNDAPAPRLGQTTFTADATTDFRRGPCKNVRNGTSVEVTGHSTVGGAIAA